MKKLFFFIIIGFTVAIFGLSGCMQNSSVPSTGSTVTTLPNNECLDQAAFGSPCQQVILGTTGSSQSNNQSTSNLPTPKPSNAINSYSNNSNNSLNTSSSIIGVDFSNNQINNSYNVNSQNTTNIYNSEENTNGSIPLGSEYNNGSNNSLNISNSIIGVDFSNNQINNTYNVNSQNTNNIYNPGDTSDGSIPLGSTFNSGSNNSLNISSSIISIDFSNNQINNTYNVNSQNTNNIYNPDGNNLDGLPSNNLSLISGFDNYSNNSINIRNSLIFINYTGNQINNTYNVNVDTTNNLGVENEE